MQSGDDGATDLGRRVVLRNERHGPDSRHLSAHLSGGDLVVEGQDLGPSTAPVSDDGEYEWRYVIRSSDLVTLRTRLEGSADEDILTSLSEWTGDRSYDFERHCRDLRHDFWCG